MPKKVAAITKCQALKVFSAFSFEREKLLIFDGKHVTLLPQMKIHVYCFLENRVFVYQHLMALSIGELDEWL